MADSHINFGYSAVATAPSPATTGISLTVLAGQGSNFSTNPPYNLVVWPAGAKALANNAEIVRVSAVVGDTFTIARGAEGSSARTIIAGDQVMNAMTKQTFTDMENMGVTGDLSGTLPSPTVPAINMNMKIGRLTAIGHSFLAGINQSSGGITDPWQEGALGKLQGLLGIHEDNVRHLAQAGSLLTVPTSPITFDIYGGWAAAWQFILPNNNVNVNAAGDSILTDPIVATNGAGLIVYGINDINTAITNGFASASSTSQLTAAYSQALRAVISRMRSGAVFSSSVSSGSVVWDSTITFTGTWSDVNTITGTPANTGPAYKTTNTNNDYVEITIPTNYTGGTIGVNFIGQQQGRTTLNGSMTSGTTTMIVTAANTFPQSGTFVANIAAEGANTAEDVLITAGASTTTWTVTRGVNGTAASAHADLAVVTMSSTNAKVTFTTNGSNATISGTQSLSGQGMTGATGIAITERFACTSADAGKTIRATVSGIVTGDTSFLAKFDSWQMEAPDSPPVAVVNVPYHQSGSVTVFSVIGPLNTAMASVVAEFDSFVKIVDLYTIWYNRSGVLASSMNNTDVTSTGINWTANSTSFTPTVGLKMTFGTAKEHLTITAVSGSAPNWTFSLLRGQDGTSKVTHSVADVMSPGDYMALDDVHLHTRGQAILAEMIYDSYTSMAPPSAYQMAEVAGNWSQGSQNFSMGIIDQNWVFPPVISYDTGATSNGRQFAFPMYVPKICTVTGMAVVPTAVSSGVVRYGIYFPDTTHSRPGSLIQDFGAQTYTATSTWTTTGFYQILQPGWYWVSAAQQTTAVTLRTFGVAGMSYPILSRTAVPTSAAGNIVGYSQTGISGAFADWVTWNEQFGVAASASSGMLIWVQLRAVHIS